jgi:hypothetical protein
MGAAAGGFFWSVFDGLGAAAGARVTLSSQRGSLPILAPILVPAWENNAGLGQFWRGAFPWLPDAKKNGNFLESFTKPPRKYLYSLAGLTNIQEIYISLTVF